LRYPEVFGRVGLHSPAVFYGDENSLLQWTRAAAESPSPPALYIDIGQNDGQPQSAYWLDRVFAWFKLPHTYLVQPGSHTEKYWSSHVPEYLRFYAGDWRPGFGPTATPLPPWE
jgi:enterochelin esterase-like enzyme